MNFYYNFILCNGLNCTYVHITHFTSYTKTVNLYYLLRIYLRVPFVYCVLEFEQFMQYFCINYMNFGSHKIPEKYMRETGHRCVQNQRVWNQKKKKKKSSWKNHATKNWAQKSFEMYKILLWVALWYGSLSVHF